MSPALITVIIVDIVSVGIFVVGLFLFRSLCINRQMLLIDLRTTRKLRTPRLFSGPVWAYSFIVLLLVAVSFVPFIR